LNRAARSGNPLPQRRDPASTPSPPLREAIMRSDSRTSSSVSPLVWLTPLPFVLAMCLPAEPPVSAAAPVERVAAASVGPAPVASSPR